MTRIITEAELLDATRKVLAERGDDFVYDRNYDSDSGSCVYSRDSGETGSCLFGAALIDHLKVPYDEQWEGATITQIINHSYLGADDQREVEFEVPYQTRMDLYYVQQAQDDGLPYGEVRQAFERMKAVQS